MLVFYRVNADKYQKYNGDNAQRTDNLHHAVLIAAQLKAEKRMI